MIEPAIPQFIAIALLTSLNDEFNVTGDPIKVTPIILHPVINCAQVLNSQPVPVHSFILES